MKNNITVNFKSNISDYVFSPWLRLEQEGLVEDTATVQEVARAIDSLYDIEPCNQDYTPEKEPEISPVTGIQEPPVPVDEFNQIVAGFMPYALCGLLPNGGLETFIRVHRSNQNEPYKLIVNGGAVSQTVRTEEGITVQITVENKSFIELEYNVLRGFSAEWVGTVYNSAGRCVPPEVELVNGGLILSEEVTGRLELSFIAVFDRVAIEFENNDPGPEELQNSILAFYLGAGYELDIESIIADDNYQDITCTESWVAECSEKICYEYNHHYSLCSCDATRMVNEYDEEPRAFDCPDNWCWSGQGTNSHNYIFDGYVTCGGEVDDSAYSVSNPDYYEEKCCFPPDFQLPSCSKKTYQNTGGAYIDKDFYRRLYGSLGKYNEVVFIPVTPIDGDCGETVVEQVVSQVSCCDNATQIEPSRETSIEVLAPETNGPVHFTGGVAPYQATVNGSGFWADSLYTKKGVTVQNGSVMVYADETACGSCLITMSDGCSIGVMTVRGTVGRWGDPIQVERLTDFPVAGFEATETPGANGIGTYSGIFDRYRCVVVTDESYAASTTAACLGSDAGPLCSDTVSGYIENELLEYCNQFSTDAGKLWVFTNMMKTDAIDPNQCCDPLQPKVPKEIRCRTTTSGYYQEWVC